LIIDVISTWIALIGQMLMHPVFAV